MSPDLRVAFQERKIRSNLDIISFQGNSSENNECSFSFVFYFGMRKDWQLRQRMYKRDKERL